MPAKSPNKKSKQANKQGSRGNTSKKSQIANNIGNKDLTNDDDAYEAIFSGEFGSLEIGSYIGNDTESGNTKHLPDAIDFEDEDELADDEDLEEETNNKSSLISDNNNAINSSSNVDLHNHLITPSQNGMVHANEMDSIMVDDHSNTFLNGEMGFPNDAGNDNNALFMDMMDNGNMPLAMNMGNTLPYMENNVPYDIFDLQNNIATNDNNMISINSHDSNDIKNDNNDSSIKIITPSIDNSNTHAFQNNTSTMNKKNKTIIRKTEDIEEMKRKKQKRDRLLLKYYFPDFKKGKILKWNKSIYRKKQNYIYQSSLLPLTTFNNKTFFPNQLKFKVQPDQRRIFNSANISTLIYESEKKMKNMGIKNITFDEIYSDTSNIQVNTDEDKENKNDKDITHTKLSEDILIATDDWDQDKIINNEYLTDGVSSLSIDAISKNNNVYDENGSSWDWDEDDLVDAKLPNAKVAELDMNDEKLLLLLNNSSKKNNKSATSNGKQFNELSILQRFNISNDQAYSILKHTHQPKVRATISNLNIEHSQPAANLQSPFYKVSLPRQQLRFFHRPNFGQNIRFGSIITFNKLKTRKRKKDKGKSIKESFATSQDLTIGDTAPVYLMEYSEQNPLALSKFGMANKLINYYRKTAEDDTLRPKLSVGETHVLGVQDKSPFWNFGFVEPGHIVPTLYNNMIRAPIFKHEVSGTDFLMVRSTGHGINNKFYLRNINHAFTVGQTFPVVEIPGPNSRKVTSIKSTRLRMIVYRILNRMPTKAISIEPIAKHFPDQDYGQNRQKVKEFMKYQREGPDKGLWKLKEGEPLLDNENTKKLLTPEQISEVESMNYGLQTSEDNEIYNHDEKLEKLEENLLPWNISKNFINATQMRAMVQIHGVGDPTGCGEGFSFLKTSMKGGFIKSSSELNSSRNGSSADLTKNKQGSHTYNVVQQQKAYDEEIIRTWYTHAKSLSVTNPFEEIDDPDMMNQTNRRVVANRDDNKILRIVRKRRDENGIIQRETIIIRDPRVIKGYLKGKEKSKEANLNVDKLLEEDTEVNNVEDLEMQKKLLQNELASLEKSQQRRAARQGVKKKGSEVSLPGSAGKVGKGKNTTRRCATCGQIGHIRTNKSCPMYNGATSTGPSTPSVNLATAPSTPGVLQSVSAQGSPAASGNL